MVTTMLETAIEAARAGGAVLRETLGARREVAWKADEAGELSVVTDADHRADAAIQAVIRAAAPGHAILSEEGDLPERLDGPLWVIDPLDGTDEFSRGSPSCCVAVAHLDGAMFSSGSPEATVVDPVGAGDAFAGGYLSEMLVGEGIERRLATATRCGSILVANAGDWEGAPRRAELRGATGNAVHR